MKRHNSVPLSTNYSLAHSAPEGISKPLTNVTQDHSAGRSLSELITPQLPPQRSYSVPNLGPSITQSYQPMSNQPSSMVSVNLPGYSASVELPTITGQSVSNTFWETVCAPFFASSASSQYMPLATSQDYSLVDTSSAPNNDAHLSEETKVDDVASPESWAFSLPDPLSQAGSEPALQSSSDEINSIEDQMPSEESDMLIRWQSLANL